MIDPPADAQGWRDVADDLRRRIESGALAPDSLLRAEADLAHDYGVGTRTVRQALRDLAADGVLYLQAGARALVRRRAHELVVVRPGAMLTMRRPTTREQRRLLLNETAMVAQLAYADEEPRVYDARATLFSFE